MTDQTIQKSTYEKTKPELQTTQKQGYEKTKLVDQTIQKSTYEKTKPELQTTQKKGYEKTKIIDQTIQKSTYEKTKPELQTTQKPGYGKYDTKSYEKTQTSTYEKVKQQQSTQKKTLQTYPTQSQILKITYDSKKIQPYIQNKSLIQNEINKFSSFTEKKNKKGSKKKDKDTQKPSYVKKFDFDKYNLQRESFNKKRKSLKNNDLNISERILDRPENLVRLEVSVERVRSDSESSEIKPETRKHERILFSRTKKRNRSFDSYGNPLTNTIRLDDTVEKKKKQGGERLPNYSRFEDYSTENYKKDERKQKQPISRYNEFLNSSKTQKKQVYDNKEKPIVNIGTLNISKVKKNEYIEKLYYNDKTNKNEYNNLKKTKTEIGVLKIKSSQDKYLPKGIKSDKNKQFGTLEKPQEEQKSFIQQQKQKTATDSLQKIIIKDNYNKQPLLNYPSSNNITSKQTTLTKNQTSVQLVPKNYQINKDYKQKTKTNVKEYQKPQKIGVTNDYQKYSLITKIQTEKEFGKNMGNINNYGVGSNKTNIDIINSSKTYKSTNKSFDNPIIKGKSLIDSKYTEKNKDKYKLSQTTMNIVKTKVQPYAQSSNLLNLSNQKETSTNFTKYYQPKKDEKKNYIISEKKSSSVPKKSTSVENLKKTSEMIDKQKISKQTGYTPYTSDEKFSKITKKTVDKQKQTKKAGYDTNIPDKTFSKITHQSIDLQSKTKQIEISKLGKKGSPGYLEPQNIIKDQQFSQYKKDQLIKKKLDTNKPSIEYKRIDIIDKEKRQKSSDKKTEGTKYQKIQTQNLIKGKEQAQIKPKKTYEPFNENEKYNYYPSSPIKNKLDKKDNSMQVTTKTYQQKIIQKSENKPSKILENNIYENKISKNKLEQYKDSSTSFNKKLEDGNRLLNQSMKYQKSGLDKGKTSLNSKEYKSPLNKNYQQVSKSKDYNIYSKDSTSHKEGKDLYSNAYDKNKKIISPSYFEKNDKSRSNTYNLNSKSKKSTTNKSKYSSILEGQMRDDSRKNGSLQKGKYRSVSPDGSGFGGESMAYFKLKFFTTKEVVQKFWNSIDNGELSLSMFEPKKYFFKPTKLSSMISPSKKLRNKLFGSLSLSNKETNYGSTRPSDMNKYGNNRIGFSNSIRI